MRRLIAGYALLLMFLSGCGQSTYAERVDRTQKLFAYHNGLNQVLQTEWARSDWGLGLRPPLRFKLIPAPPPPKANAEGVVEVVPDTRQPPYLGVELPGLVAAWEIPGEAYLYLCSNHQRFVDQQAATGELVAPANFFVDLEAALQQGFEFMLSADPAKGPAEVHATFEERIPKSDEFAPQKLYRTIRIEKQSEPRLAANVYEHAADKIQVALILVYSPKNPGRFESDVRRSLETLRADSTIPKRAGTPGTTGSPAGGGGKSAF